MSGRASCIQVKVPVRLTARMRSHLSGEMSRAGSKASTPALVTRMVIGPSVSRTDAEHTLQGAAVGDVDLERRHGVPAARRVAAARVPKARPSMSRSATAMTVVRELPGDAETHARGRAGHDGHPVAHTRPLGRGELDVQVVQAAQDPRRLVREVSGTRRAVMLVGEPDVAHPVEDPLDADATLGTRPAALRDRSATPTTEGHVLLRVGAVQPELLGTLEPSWIAIGRAVEDHHRRSRCDLHAADRGAAAGQPEVRLHRALDAQRLLDEVRDALPVRPQLVLELGVLAEVLQADGEEPGRRLLARRRRGTSPSARRP